MKMQKAFRGSKQAGHTMVSKPVTFGKIIITPERDKLDINESGDDMKANRTKYV